MIGTDDSSSRVLGRIHSIAVTTTDDSTVGPTVCAGTFIHLFNNKIIMTNPAFVEARCFEIAHKVG